MAATCPASAPVAVPDEGEDEEEGTAPPLPSAQSSTWKDDAVALLRLSVPLVLTALFTRTLMVQDLILIGHFLDTDAVAATALGSTLYQMFYYFLLGMGSAVDTMCSQSHGAGAHIDTVLWAQRGFFILFLCAIPMILVLGFGSEWILCELMRQDEGVAKMAATYIRVLLIGMPASICFDVLVKFLQSQKIMMPFLYVSISMNVFNIGLDVWLLSTIGFVGAPIATTTCRYLSILFLGVYVWYARLHEKHAAFPGWQMSEIVDTSACARMLKMGLAGGVMVTAEVFCFEITTIFAGQLHDKALLAAHFIMMSYIGSVYSILPSSISVASSIRVGNLVGERDEKTARSTAMTGIVLGGASMLISAVTIFIDRTLVGRIYSSDKEIIRVVARLTLVASLFQVFDGIQAGAVGAMRGLGKQSVAALITGLGFSATGVSCSYFFCFVADYKLMGLWFGLFCGILSTAIISVIVLLWTDFENVLGGSTGSSSSEGNHRQRSDTAASACRRKDKFVAYEYLSVHPKDPADSAFSLVGGSEEDMLDEDDITFEY